MMKHSDERPFVCDLCEYSAKYRENLQRHLRSHTSLRLFSCNMCDFKSQRADSVQRHMNTHTCTPSLKKQFTCPLFDDKTCNKNKFRIHMAEKHSIGIESIKSYNCPECDYTTYRSYSFLKYHMIKHSDERPWATKTNSLLHQHVKTNSLLHQPVKTNSLLHQHVKTNSLLHQHVKTNSLLHQHVKTNSLLHQHVKTNS